MNKKCAIFNYWWAWNDAHGASLTALALYKLIEELGYEPCLIMTVFKGMSLLQCKQGRHFRFIERHATHSKKNYQTGEEYEKLNSQYEHFVVGSDQVLRVEWVPDEWFLYSIRNCKNKIIMSGSFGGNQIQATEQRIERVAKYLEDFDAISVREKDAIEVYQRYFGKRSDIEWVMDPVFLINPKFYYELMDKYMPHSEIRNCEKETIFLYILDSTPEIEKLKEKIVGLYDAKIVEDREEMMAEEFLYMVAHSTLVVTDSFHGMCFSIVLNRPFYCIYNKMRGTSRVDTIKELFDLDKVILDSQSIDLCDFRVPEIDYEKINMIIEKERERGRNWLKHKLERNDKGV